MTSARATIEHRISGQIGQPAACMIESNRALSWGAAGESAARGLWRPPRLPSATTAMRGHSHAAPERNDHPLQLWTTLWATSPRSQSHARCGALRPFAKF